MLLDELSFEIRLERRTTKGSSSARIMRETHNQTKYKCLPKFVQTDQCVSSIKTVNELEKVPSCCNQIINWDDKVPRFIGRTFSVPKSATDGKQPVNYRQEKVKTTSEKIS